ncbi:MAG: aminoacyl-histidine dipeptidase [Lachnospira sp.]
MNKRVLENIQPENVFRFFEDICNIPHGSGNVKMISDYLVEFAESRNLWYRRDDNLNVIIKKPANNSESKNPVIIQGHMDMVTVKTDDKVKDMEKEGLDILVEGNYIKADRTSLGGDDGIAVAYALAILDSKDISHPPIEAVITVDEEIGMLGAENLDCSDIEGRIMLNIDSEEEGIFLSSCAGGATVKGIYPVKKEIVSGVKLEINITGLTSGHSGTDIIFQRANGNVILGKMLFELSRKYNFNIVSVMGGEKDNSIAPFAKGEIIVEQEDAKEFQKDAKEYAKDLLNEYSSTDKDMIIDVSEEGSVEESALDHTSTTKIILGYTHIPDGVIKMSNEIQGLVQTSLNLGVVHCSDENITFTYLLRSSLESEKEYLTNRVASMISLLGGEYEITGKYPAWEYKKESPLRKIMSDSYKKLYGHEPEIQAIHAGVECGLFASKLEGLDCVSFGPDIKDIHTFKERLDIKSTERTWELIKEVLKTL